MVRRIIDPVGGLGRSYCPGRKVDLSEIRRSAVMGSTPAANIFVLIAFGFKVVHDPLCLYRPHYSVHLLSREEDGFSENALGARIVPPLGCLVTAADDHLRPVGHPSQLTLPSRAKFSSRARYPATSSSALALSDVHGVR